MNLPQKAWFEWDPSLLVPAIYDLIWGTIAFFIVMFLMYKVAWPTFSKLLDERREKIEEGLAAAERAREEIKHERADLEAELTAAKKEAVRVREEAQANAKAIVADARAKANDEADRIIEQAQRQIIADRQAAEASLRGDVGNLATTLAGRIVGANVADRDVSRQVVDSFLADLESSTTTAHPEA